MKNIKKVISILILSLGIICLFQSDVKAANAKISVSNTNPKPGEKVTVTANVTAGAWNLKFSGNGKNETIYGYTNKNGNSSASKSITFTAGTVGQKYTFSLNGDMTDINADNAQNVSKSTSITVAKNTVSNQSNGATSSQNSNSNNNSNNDSNNRSSNSNSNQNNSNNSTEKDPTFKTVNEMATVTEKINFRSSYSTSSSVLGKISEGETVTRIGIGSNGWSKIQYDGKTGYIKSEYLSVSNEATEENQEETPFGLDILKISDLELNPKFSTDIYEYTISTTDKIKKLDIKEAVANVQTAKIEILGNEDFAVGKNIVRISVTDTASERSAVYQITVNIEEIKEAPDQTIFNDETNKINNDINIKKWIIRGIIIFVTIVMIIMFILRYRTLRHKDKEKEYSRRDGYVIIDEKFDELEKDKDKIAQIEQFDEEIEKNKTKEIEPPVQPRRMKKTKGKHF